MIAIGVDVGGTSIKGAFITDEGTLLSKFQMPVDKDAVPEVEIGKLCEIINQEIKDHDYQVVGIGLGIPGVLNMDEGIIVYSPNLPTWGGFYISKFIE